MKGETFSGTPLGKCRCGGDLCASLDKEGRPDGLMHSEPMCDAFNRMSNDGDDMIAFLRANAVDRQNVM